MLVRLLFDWLFGRREPEPTSADARLDDAAQPAGPYTNAAKGGSNGKTRAATKDAAARPTFSILVTRLAGDDQGTVTNRLTDVLSARSDSRLVYIDQPAADGMTGDGLQGLNAVLGRCWRWIDDNEADVAVWGAIEGETVRLRFVPHDAAVEGESATLSLAASLVLPVGLDDADGDMVFTAALAAVVPRSDYQDRARVSRLETARKVAERVALDDAASPETALAALSVLMFIAARKKDEALQETVLERLRRVSATVNRDDRPVSWALCHRLLGDVLYDLSVDGRDVDGLEEAAEAYRMVTGDGTMSALPHEWAEAQARLGKTVYKIASFKPDLSQMKFAVAAYNQALSVFKKAMFPFRWAEIQSNVAQALMAYGDANANVEIMQQAAEVLRAVLTIRTRRANAVHWAATQNNLGAARFAYAKHTRDQAALREAHECFAAALEVYQAMEATRLVHVTNSNLMRVERLLGSWTDGGDDGGQAEQVSPTPKKKGGGAAAAE